MMGNNKFKFSDMIPNGWFYKLRDMSKSRKRNNASHVIKNKKVTTSTSHHYFPIEPSNNKAGKFHNSPIYTKHSDFVFGDSPRKSSSKRKTKKKTIYEPSSPPIVSSPVLESWSFHSLEKKNSPNWTKPKHETRGCDSSSESDCHEFNARGSRPNRLVTSECSCRVSSSTNDIIIDMKSGSTDAISPLGLAPILTKPAKFEEQIFINPTQTCLVSRKSSANSKGIKLRVNSPKLANRKVQAYARRSVSCKGSNSKNAGFPEGFAVVKSSVDPQKDFRDSMVEMIRENQILASKDLENLLACYLSLNSSEYHDLIVKAFEQIWYDMAQLKL
ncbi:transcription repressor OFP1 [Arachis duranensis]|uniref:Transcription repressor n=2 Tax=Arachis TaxID=3817 RepID=A0A6P4CEX4_ARADU|nr:transcription repressor OFP1 [Arachis duranensis]XP_025607518.1 transcription repressor OFP1-like [Arachis hypogaea]QHO48476.1 Transcription repressor [Arachis hypogaea]